MRDPKINAATKKSKHSTIKKRKSESIEWAMPRRDETRNSSAQGVIKNKQLSSLTARITTMRTKQPQSRRRQQAQRPTRRHQLMIPSLAAVAVAAVAVAGLSVAHAAKSSFAPHYLSSLTTVQQQQQQQLLATTLLRGGTSSSSSSSFSDEDLDEYIEFILAAADGQVSESENPLFGETATAKKQQQQQQQQRITTLLADQDQDQEEDEQEVADEQVVTELAKLATDEAMLNVSESMESLEEEEEEEQVSVQVQFVEEEEQQAAAALPLDNDDDDKDVVLASYQDSSSSNAVSEDSVVEAATTTTTTVDEVAQNDEIVAAAASVVSADSEVLLEEVPVLDAMIEALVASVDEEDNNKEEEATEQLPELQAETIPSSEVDDVVLDGDTEVDVFILAQEVQELDEMIESLVGTVGDDEFTFENDISMNRAVQELLLHANDTQVVDTDNVDAAATKVVVMSDDDFFLGPSAVEEVPLLALALVVDVDDGADTDTPTTDSGASLLLQDDSITPSTTSEIQEQGEDQPALEGKTSIMTRVYNKLWGVVGTESSSLLSIPKGDKEETRQLDDSTTQPEQDFESQPEGSATMTISDEETMQEETGSGLGLPLVVDADDATTDTTTTDSGASLLLQDDIMTSTTTETQEQGEDQPVLEGKTSIMTRVYNKLWGVVGTESSSLLSIPKGDQEETHQLDDSTTQPEQDFESQPEGSSTMTISGEETMLEETGPGLGLGLVQLEETAALLTPSDKEEEESTRAAAAFEASQTTMLLDDDAEEESISETVAQEEMDEFLQGEPSVTSVVSVDDNETGEGTEVSELTQSAEEEARFSPEDVSTSMEGLLAAEAAALAQVEVAGAADTEISATENFIPTREKESSSIYKYYSRSWGSLVSALYWKRGKPAPAASESSAKPSLEPEVEAVNEMQMDIQLQDAEPTTSEPSRPVSQRDYSAIFKKYYAGVADVEREQSSIDSNQRAESSFEPEMPQSVEAELQDTKSTDSSSIFMKYYQRALGTVTKFVETKRDEPFKESVHEDENHDQEDPIFEPEVYDAIVESAEIQEPPTYEEDSASEIIDHEGGPSIFTKYYSRAWGTIANLGKKRDESSSALQADDEAVNEDPTISTETLVVEILDPVDTSSEMNIDMEAVEIDEEMDDDEIETVQNDAIVVDEASDLEDDALLEVGQDGLLEEESEPEISSELKVDDQIESEDEMASAGLADTIEESDEEDEMNIEMEAVEIDEEVGDEETETVQDDAIIVEDDALLEVGEDVFIEEESESESEISGELKPDDQIEIEDEMASAGLAGTIAIEESDEEDSLDLSPHEEASIEEIGVSPDAAHDEVLTNESPFVDVVGDDQVPIENLAEPVESTASITDGWATVELSEDAAGIRDQVESDHVSKYAVEEPDLSSEYDYEYDDEEIFAEEMTEASDKTEDKRSKALGDTENEFYEADAVDEIEAIDKEGDIADLFEPAAEQEFDVFEEGFVGEVVTDIAIEAVAVDDVGDLELEEAAEQEIDVLEEGLGEVMTDIALEPADDQETEVAEGNFAGDDADDLEWEAAAEQEIEELDEDLPDKDSLDVLFEGAAAEEDEVIEIDGDADEASVTAESSTILDEQAEGLSGEVEGLVEEFDAVERLLAEQAELMANDDVALEPEIVKEELQDGLAFIATRQRKTKPIKKRPKSRAHGTKATKATFPLPREREPVNFLYRMLIARGLEQWLMIVIVFAEWCRVYLSPFAEFAALIHSKLQPLLADKLRDNLLRTRGGGDAVEGELGIKVTQNERVSLT
jgi:hypothetical protein